MFLSEDWEGFELVFTSLLAALVASTLIGLVGGWVTMRVTPEVISYKCEQRGKMKPETPISERAKLIGVATVTVFSIVAITCGLLVMGGQYKYQSFFAVVFAMIAVSVSLTDISLRIIPNESVILMLLLGLIYRLLFDGFSGLMNSLLALGLTIVIFGGSSALFFFMKKQIGLGAGDLKWAMVISIIVGYPGLLWFLCGMAAAVLIYVFVGMLRKRFLMADYFPMAAHLSCGFLLALLAPYITAVFQLIS